MPEGRADRPCRPAIRGSDAHARSQRRQAGAPVRAPAHAVPGAVRYRARALCAGDQLRLVQAGNTRVLLGGARQLRHRLQRYEVPAVLLERLPVPGHLGAPRSHGRHRHLAPRARPSGPHRGGHAHGLLHPRGSRRPDPRAARHLHARPQGQPVRSRAPGPRLRDDRQADERRSPAMGLLDHRSSSPRPAAGSPSSMAHSTASRARSRRRRSSTVAVRCGWDGRSSCRSSVRTSSTCSS